MESGDIVLVYVDLEGKCRKGFIKYYNGKRVFLGNGIVVFVRKDLFCL